jgi:hypothetical protein
MCHIQVNEKTEERLSCDFRANAREIWCDLNACEILESSASNQPKNKQKSLMQVKSVLSFQYI